MKKLLMLALILGIGSLAAAAIDYQLAVNGTIVGDQEIVEIAPSDNILISIFSMNNDAPADFWLGVVSGPGEWLQGSDNIVGQMGDPGPTVAMDAFGPEWNSVAWFNAPAPGSWAPGEWIEFGFHCTGEGDVLISCETGGGVPFDQITIHQAQVPEPASLALLGLGGLFLRRRK